MSKGTKLINFIFLNLQTMLTCEELLLFATVAPYLSINYHTWYNANYISPSTISSVVPGEK